MEQLGAGEFAAREAAQNSLRKLGYKAEVAIRSGLKSENPEVVKRCGELLDVLRTDLLGGKDSPVWQKFKAIAGDNADAWKLYLRAIGTRNALRCCSMRSTIPRQPRPATRRSARRSARYWVSRASLGVAPPPKPPGFPDRDVTPDDLTALLVLGLLPRGDQGEVPHESSAVISHVLIAALTAETKKPFGKLFAAWTEPRPGMWYGAFNIALTEQVAAMTPVARKGAHGVRREGANSGGQGKRHGPPIARMVRHD